MKAETMDNIRIKEKNSYLFSVVMAVYNVQDYLREAVDSVLNQKFDLSKVQLILVDDGSTDESGHICDEYQQAYPDTITVVHQPNARQAAARNTGLQLTCGKYINFLDADDKLSPDTFSLVYRFFERHEQDTDVVSVPMMFFGALDGAHWQNTKYDKGSRVIDLKKEHAVQQASASSAFYHCRVKPLLHFDTTLPSSEDFKMNLCVLAQKQTLGVVTGCFYGYRRRPQGDSSTVQGMVARRSWYFEWYTAFCQWAFQMYREQHGQVPGYVQYGILCDFLWRYYEDLMPVMEQVLSEEEQAASIELMRECLSLFDDAYILQLPQLLLVHKYAMLQDKYQLPPVPVKDENGVCAVFGKQTKVRLEEMETQLDFVSLQDDKLTVEGICYAGLLGPEEEAEVFLEIDGREFPCNLVCRANADVYRFRRLVARGIGFCGTVELDKQKKKHTVRIVCYAHGERIVKECLVCGPFVGCSSQVNHSFCVQDGWLMKIQNGELRFEKAGFLDVLWHETVFCYTLLREKGVGAKKAIPIRIFSRLMRKIKRRKIWLISDRINRAGDNGEAMFHYLCAHKPEGVDVYFLLTSDSPDYERLCAVGPVIPYHSMKRKLAHVIADCIISSAGDDHVINPFFQRREYYKDILSGIPYVFLQHGIIRDDLSKWLNRYNKNIDGFITSAWGEYDSILQDAYGYPAEKVWLTGMPRFDRLEYQPEKKITIMPTWRKYLMTGFDSQKGVWQIAEGFEQSAFFRFYAGLLKHPRLLKEAKQYGYTLQFYPHPNIIQNVSLFEADPSIRILDESVAYKTVYAQSDLVVTDYSSAVVDFSYMNRPIIYAQFDADEFFSGSHVYTRGYFDYERDGFGPVTTDLESTVDAIIAYMQNGCELQPEYQQRIDRFFAFRDRNNCERVLEHILKLKGV